MPLRLVFRAASAVDVKNSPAQNPCRIADFFLNFPDFSKSDKESIP
jgi:hypothetical protein